MTTINTTRKEYMNRTIVEQAQHMYKGQPVYFENMGKDRNKLCSRLTDKRYDA